MKRLFLAAAGFVACAAVTPAAAVPMSPASPTADTPSLVEQAQGYRYRRDCYWTGSGWGYRHGGKVLVCRPHKPPGYGWTWYSEGGRHGWYHAKRKTWHHRW